jgi:myo-inositol 2-dehydrogenase/D-chiro-inositol 1-dehydrogenase
MARTRVGFIGAGGVARRHVEVLRGFEDVATVGVTDLDPGAAGGLARAAGATAYPSLRALLDGCAPDAVYVCVPPFGHGEPERCLIEADVPFFVEKPVSVGLEIAEELAAGVSERRLVTATGYHWRYLSGVRAARRLLTKTPARLVVGAWRDKVPPPAWWLQTARSGGQIVEQATHLLDCIVALVGDVHQVCAFGQHAPPAGHPAADVDAATAAILRFTEGAVGSLTAASTLPGKQRANIELICDGRRIDIGETAYSVEDDHGRTVHDESPGAAKRLVDRAFIDAVQGRPGDVLVPYGVALRTHQIACAIARSALDGTPVELS